MGKPSTLDVDITLSRSDFELVVQHAFDLEGVTALFGPSGSGKTSLLRVIAGLETSATGRVQFRHETWQDEVSHAVVPSHARAVGYVFQDGRLFPHLSVSGNLAYALKRSHQSARSQSPVTWNSVVSALDLDPLLSRKPGTLSGGERQRVALGRAVMRAPRLLLLDEPLSALDLRRKQEILPYLERLTDAFSIPALYVTHAIDEVARIANRIVVLQDGRIAAHGAVGEVFDRLDLGPVTEAFDAGSILEATVASHDPEYLLTELEFRGQCISIPQSNLPVGTQVRLRVRARDVSLALQRPQDLTVRNIIAGHLVDMSIDPNSALAETLIDVGGVHLRARITRRSASELGLSPGRAVFALIKSVSLDGTGPVSR
ncbi:MAG: molybdenum ABC transporter ATP-binding protein [Pseudomonadota bacterium]